MAFSRSTTVSLDLRKAELTPLHYLVDLVIWLIVGAAAGWIAGIVVKGAGFGPLGNIIVGILGSIVAGFIFPLLGIAFLPGLIGDVVYAAIGAIILLLVVFWFRRA